jgi:hypothetical protein
MQDRADPHARERAVDIAREDPPPGVSPQSAAVAIAEVLDSIPPARSARLRIDSSLPRAVGAGARPAYPSANGVFFAICQRKSGEPSSHNAGPRSPSARLTSSTPMCAATSAWLSAAFLASRTIRRAAISRPTRSARPASSRPGLAIRRSLPRTTKWRLSGVTGCFTIRVDYIRLARSPRRRV